MLYLFSIVAVNYHKCGGLKQNLLLYRSGDGKSKISLLGPKSRCPQVPTKSSWRLLGRTCFASYRFWRLPPFLDSWPYTPASALATSASLTLTLFGLPWDLLSVIYLSSLLIKRTFIIIIHYIHPGNSACSHYLKIPNQITSSKSLLSCKEHSHRFQGLGHGHPWETIILSTSMYTS